MYCIFFDKSILLFIKPGKEYKKKNLLPNTGSPPKGITN